MVLYGYKKNENNLNNLFKQKILFNEKKNNNRELF